MVIQETSGKYLEIFIRMIPSELMTQTAIFKTPYSVMFEISASGLLTVLSCLKMEYPIGVMIYRKSGLKCQAVEIEFFLPYKFCQNRIVEGILWCCDYHIFN